MPRRSIDKAAPKVHEGKDEVNEQDRQMDTMSSHLSSGIDLNLLKFIRWSVKSKFGMIMLLQLVIWILSLMLPLRVEIIAHIW